MRAKAKESWKHSEQKKRGGKVRALNVAAVFSGKWATLKMMQLSNVVGDTHTHAH